ncbi:MAG: hypothetical protein Q9181_006276 [Wetmoreana brouardii]
MPLSSHSATTLPEHFPVCYLSQSCTLLIEASSSFVMEYFIDDMLNSSRRGSTKSLPFSPAPAEAPLHPAPTPARTKKGKSVKVPGGTSSAMAEGSKMSAAPIAAAVPLPETPVLSTASATAGQITAEEGMLSPKSVATEAALAPSDYFSIAELPPPQQTLAAPEEREALGAGAPAFFPQPVPELSKPAGDPLPIIQADPAPAAEEQDAAVHAGEASSMTKELQEDVPENRVGSPPPVLHLSHSPIPVIQSQPAILIGLSGSPLSGKTTLAHLLSSILPPVTQWFIIHQADFFNPQRLLVPDNNGEVDSDGRHAINFSAFKRVLEYAKHEGRLPPALLSLQPEAERECALSKISSAVMEQMQASLVNVQSLQSGQPIVIVEGSSLYRSETVRSLLDIKFLLRTSKEIAKTRRFEESNNLDSNSEGTHHDRIDYFDRVVWRNYIREHEVLFEDGNVEGRPQRRICEGVGIQVQPDLDTSLSETLQWVLDVFRRDIEEVVACRHDREIASLVDLKARFEFCRCDEGLLGKIRQTIFDLL